MLYQKFSLTIKSVKFNLSCLHFGDKQKLVSYDGSGFCHEHRFYDSRTDAQAKDCIQTNCYDYKKEMPGSPGPTQAFFSNRRNNSATTAWKDRCVKKLENFYCTFLSLILIVSCYKMKRHIFFKIFFPGFVLRFVII